MGSYGTVPDVAVDVAEEEAPLEWWRVACEVESVRGCAIHHSLQDVLHAASTPVSYTHLTLPTILLV